MYRKNLFLFLLSILSVTLIAQTGSVTGVVADTLNNEKVPYATIALYPAGSEVPFKGEISDGEGRFRLTGIPYGEYRLVISFLGYKPAEIPRLTISAGTPGVDLGTVNLALSATQLGQVDVVAVRQTASSQIDRTTYQAGDFETVRGGNAADILSRLPSVSVDSDGQVSVRGRTDFMVYLNGKPVNIDPSMLLAQLSANSIESVEIITVPGARFEAQGAGGIININTTRGGLEGLSVSTSLNGASAPWGNRTDKYLGDRMNSDALSGSLDLLFNRERLSLYANLNISERNVNGIRNGNARILQEGGNYYNLTGSGSRPEKHNSYSINSGLIYDVSDRAKLDISYYHGYRGENRGALYLYRGTGLILSPGDENGIDYTTFNPNRGDRYARIHTGSISYNLRPSDNSRFDISVVAERSGLIRELSNPNWNHDEETDQITTLEKDIRQSDDTPLTGLRFYLDYARELANGNTIEAGIQPQYLVNTGSFRYDTLTSAANTWGAYSSLENDFELRRGIYAAYLNYGGTRDRLEFMAGVRSEFTDQVMDIRNPDYFSLFDRETKERYTISKISLFPSLHLKFNATANDELTMAASRRINRPQTQTMAPFLYRRHHEVYEVGDPALQPEYLTNAELSYLRRTGKHNFRITAFFRATDNALFRIYTTYPEENILIRSFTNAGNTKAAGAELNANIVAGSFMKLFLGASLYNFNVQGTFFGSEEDNTSLNWDLKGNMSLFITQTLRYTMDFEVRSATVTAQGADELFFISGAAVNWTPASMAQWNFSLRVQDIFGTNITNWSTRAYDSDNRQLFFQETDYTRYGPIAGVGITYTFNLNGRNLKRTVSTFGEEEF